MQEEWERGVAVMVVGKAEGMVEVEQVVEQGAVKAEEMVVAKEVAEREEGAMEAGAMGVAEMAEQATLVAVAE